MNCNFSFHETGCCDLTWEFRCWIIQSGLLKVFDISGFDYISYIVFGWFFSCTDLFVHIIYTFPWRAYPRICSFYRKWRSLRLEFLSVAWREICVPLYTCNRCNVYLKSIRRFSNIWCLFLFLQSWAYFMILKSKYFINIRLNVLGCDSGSLV